MRPFKIWIQLSQILSTNPTERPLPHCNVFQFEGYYICLVTFGLKLQFLLKPFSLWLLCCYSGFFVVVGFFCFFLFLHCPSSVLYQAICTAKFLSLIFMENPSQIVVHFSELQKFCGRWNGIKLP